MKVRELFKIGDVMHSIGDKAIYLDRDNCLVNNKTKKDDAVILNLKRVSDGEEGKSYLRVRGEFENISAQLLNWAFASESIVGLTLNQLDDLETNLNIEKVQGRIQLSKE